MTEKCARCPALVDWAVTPAGRPMPVDHGSAGDPAGNLEVWRDEDGVLFCRVLRKGAEPAEGRKRGVSHWATCPEAEAFRGQRARAAGKIPDKSQVTRDEAPLGQGEIACVSERGVREHAPELLGDPGEDASAGVAGVVIDEARRARLASEVDRLAALTRVTGADLARQMEADGVPRCAAVDEPRELDDWPPGSWGEWANR